MRLVGRTRRPFVTVFLAELTVEHGRRMCVTVVGRPPLFVIGGRPVGAFVLDKLPILYLAKRGAHRA